jgi:hypothetical protein
VLNAVHRKKIKKIPLLIVSLDIREQYFQVKRDMQEKRVNLGNKGLTKLWAMNPDNLG